MRHTRIFKLFPLIVLLLCLAACGNTPAVTDDTTASAVPFVCPHTELYDNGQCKKCLNYFGKLGDNIEWSFIWEDCALTLTGSGEMTAAFENERVLHAARTVTIGDGITSIADCAFKNGKKITEVYIPESVTAIGDEAFSGTALTKVQLPSNLRSVGSGVFYRAPLTELTLPEGLTDIGDRAFSGTALTKVQLPDSLQSVDAGAFSAAPLTELTLPEGLTNIGDGAFSGAAFKEIHIPAAVRHIGANAFDSNSLLRYTVSPDNAVYSADAEGALFDKDGQTLLAFPTGKSGACTVPEGTVRIADEAFEGCAVTAVTFPPSLVEIGVSAFLNCRSLTELHTSGNITMCDTYSFDRTPWWEAQREISSRDGVGIYLDRVLVHAYRANEVFTVREGTEYIAAQAFIHSDCESLKTLVLPSSLRHIGDGAFSLCKNLQNVTLPEGLLTVGHAAFADKTALTEINIPASVTLVSTEAFRGCTSLSRVTFSGTDCEIGENAFLYDEHVTLCGAADSTAARYAAANGITFEPIK